MSRVGGGEKWHFFNEVLKIKSPNASVDGAS